MHRIQAITVILSIKAAHSAVKIEWLQLLVITLQPKKLNALVTHNKVHPVYTCCRSVARSYNKGRLCRIYAVCSMIGLVSNSSRCLSVSKSISRRGVLHPSLNRIAGQTFVMYNLPKSLILYVDKYSLQPNRSVDSK